MESQSTADAAQVRFRLVPCRGTNEMIDAGRTGRLTAGAQSGIVVGVAGQLVGVEAGGVPI
jgi:hypothetical protein